MESVSAFFYGTAFGVFFALLILVIAGALIASVAAGHYKISGVGPEQRAVAPVPIAAPPRLANPARQTFPRAPSMKEQISALLDQMVAAHNVGQATDLKAKILTLIPDEPEAPPVGQLLAAQREPVLAPGDSKAYPCGTYAFAGTGSVLPESCPVHGAACPADKPTYSVDKGVFANDSAAVELTALGSVSDGSAASGAISAGLVTVAQIADGTITVGSVLANPFPLVRVDPRCLEEN